MSLLRWKTYSRSHVTSSHFEIPGNKHFMKMDGALTNDVQSPAGRLSIMGEEERKSVLKKRGGTTTRKTQHHSPPNPAIARIPKEPYTNRVNKIKISQYQKPQRNHKQKKKSKKKAKTMHVQSSLYDVSQESITGSNIGHPVERIDLMFLARRRRWRAGGLFDPYGKLLTHTPPVLLCMSNLFLI